MFDGFGNDGDGMIDCLGDGDELWGWFLVRMYWSRSAAIVIRSIRRPTEWVSRHECRGWGAADLVGYARRWFCH